MAESMKNLPPALVITCESDTLRDDGFLYIKRLRADGVPVLHHHKRNSVHGYINFVKAPLWIEAARQTIADIVTFIEKIWGQSSTFLCRSCQSSYRWMTPDEWHQMPGASETHHLSNILSTLCTLGPTYNEHFDAQKSARSSWVFVVTEFFWTLLLMRGCWLITKLSTHSGRVVIVVTWYPGTSEVQI